MKQLEPLYAKVAQRVQAPVCVVLGPPWPVAQLVRAINLPEVVCVQMDLHQAERLRDCLREAGTTASVETVADVWDLPPRFATVIFPAAAHSERELKLDVVEQAYHILRPGGTFIALSEYERDQLFARWLKKVYGRYGETPASPEGTAIFATKTDAGRPRRRHEVTFHARIGEGPSVHIVSRPGTFSYGRFDEGSRAMLEIADIRPGDRVLDLGCGNGAVGCLAGTRVGPTGSVTFIDSNLRSVALAQQNAQINATPQPRFVAASRLQGLEPASFDVILANPPYYALTEITRLFISGAKPLLAPGGRYYLVTKMPTAVVPMIFQTFGDCTVHENRGYSVITAIRPASERRHS
ncbi:MAG: class I SAM-dependent methyltransferase [Gemmataceae bacterium]|nr:class I SAM-dependent methyltransferase [Gemmataceae bacterium]